MLIITNLMNGLDLKFVTIKRGEEIWEMMFLLKVENVLIRSTSSYCFILHVFTVGFIRCIDCCTESTDLDLCII